MTIPKKPARHDASFTKQKPPLKSNQEDKSVKQKTLKVPHKPLQLCRVARWLLGKSLAVWLMSVGYAHSPTCHHTRRLKLVLELESIGPDANLTAHQLDTIFTSIRTRPRYRTTRRAFERFLAARGLPTVEPDVDRFTLSLKAYRFHLI